MTKVVLQDKVLGPALLLLLFFSFVIANVDQNDKDLLLYLSDYCTVSLVFGCLLAGFNTNQLQLFQLKLVVETLKKLRANYCYAKKNNKRKMPALLAPVL